MLVDSHCHLDFPDFAEDLDGIVSRARAAGIGRMVTISTRVRKLDQLLAIAGRYDDVYCSVGTPPHNADEEDGISPDELIALTQHPKVVALGEAGLDYFYDDGSPEAQAVAGQMPALAAPGGGKIDLSQIEGQVRESSIKKVGEVVSAHPEEALAIIRTWLHEPA